MSVRSFEGTSTLKSRIVDGGTQCLNLIRCWRSSSWSVRKKRLEITDS